MKTRVVSPRGCGESREELGGSPPTQLSFLKKLGLALIVFALGAWAGCFATGFAAGLGSLCR